MHLLYMTLYLSDKFAPMQECYINKRTYPICHEHIQSLIAEGLSWGSNKPQQHMVLLKGKLVWFMIYFIKTTQIQSTLLSYYTCVAFIHVTGGSGSVHYFVSEGKCSFWWRDFTWYGGCRLGAVDLSHQGLHQALCQTSISTCCITYLSALGRIEYTVNNSGTVGLSMGTSDRKITKLCRVTTRVGREVYKLTQNQCIVPCLFLIHEQQRLDACLQDICQKDLLLFLLLAFPLSPLVQYLICLSLLFLNVLSLS